MSADSPNWALPTSARPGERTPPSVVRLQEAGRPVSNAERFAAVRGGLGCDHDLHKLSAGSGYEFLTWQVAASTRRGMAARRLPTRLARDSICVPNRRTMAACPGLPKPLGASRP